MKELEKSVDELFFTCEKCGTVRDAIDFDNVPEKNKQAVKKMMNAMNRILKDNDEIPAFIVFCKRCDEYSTVIIGGGGEWM